jgi:predicted anti-sigma-YlaC factor YlaD
MILNMPLAIWFGILTILSLFVTFSLGIAMHVFRKPVFKYHKTFAFLTMMLGIVHTILAVLLWFFGILI